MAPWVLREWINDSMVRCASLACALTESLRGPAGSQPSEKLKSRRQRGFTLIELMMVVAIIGILASLAVADYRLYVLRGEAAQTLTNYDHIRQVIAVQTTADGTASLQTDSVPGVVPPRLAGTLDTREFNGPDGQQLQLVLAPAGTFASYPDQAVYALIDSSASNAGQLRLRVLNQALPHSSGDKVWLSNAQLMFPVDVGVAVGAGNGGGTTGGGSTGGGTTGGGTTGGGTTGGGTTGGGTTGAPGGTAVTGSSTPNGTSRWTANVNICVGAAGGGALTGYNDIKVVYQVVTKDSTFTATSPVDSATGCMSASYPGQIKGVAGDVSVRVVSVVNAAVSTSSPTPLWDGATPSLTLTRPQ